jgi:hypothetical protein
VKLDDKLLAIYLNDHLAGSTAGRELAKRTLSANRGTSYGPFLERLTNEIVEDRATLVEVMDAAGVAEDRVKAVVALAGERAGRLKLNGRLRGYSPLSRVVEFEGLALGVTGKLALWRALRDLNDERLTRFDFGGLASRAERQQEELEQQRLAATREAFAGDGEG